jgi:hypothetical protein
MRANITDIGQRDEGMIDGGAIGGNEALSQVLVAAEWALEMQKSLALIY